jgi:hypothetical protein
VRCGCSWHSVPTQCMLRWWRVRLVVERGVSVSLFGCWSPVCLVSRAYYQEWCRACCRCAAAGWHSSGLPLLWVLVTDLSS